MGLPGKPQNGGSRPRFYEFDDGVTRLVKWHPSRHGNKACYNEIVASRLGQLLGAPILRGLLVYVPDEIIPADHRADGGTPGFHFAVTRMEGENFVPAQHYVELENSSELPFAAVHLAWLAVGDQEGHNQFLQRLELRQHGSPPRLTKYFRLIDMGQMFGNWNWDAATVVTPPNKYRLPSHLADKLTWEKLGPAIQSLTAIDESSIRACFDDIPDEWNVSTVDRQAAVTRVLAARMQIEAIVRNGNPAIKPK